MAIHCQNCGAQVTKKYARSRSFPGERAPRACPHCDDKLWDGAEVRDAKSQRR